MFKLEDINKQLIILIALSFRFVPIFYSSSYLNYLLIIILFLLTILNILKLKLPRDKFFTMVTLLLLSLLIFIVYREDNLFIYYVTALAFLKGKDNIIIKKFLIISLCLFSLILVSGKLSIINVIEGGRYIDGETIVRNSLGFGNINSAFVYYLGIIFGLYYFLHNHKFKLLLLYVPTTLMALYMYRETDCRTGFYIYLLFVVVSLIYNKKLNNYFKRIVPYLFVFFTIFSFLLAIIYGTTMSNEVNSLLSGRPYFSYYYIKNFKFISLVGTGVVGHYVLDNYYLSLLVKSGIVGYITYLYVFTKSSKIISDNYAYSLVILFTLIYGILECGLYGNFIYIIMLKNIVCPDDEVLLDEKN